MTGDRGRLQQLRARWEAAWPEALAVWSRFTKLSQPRWCLTVLDEQTEGLSESFAMIRLTDQGVVVSLRQVASLELGEFAQEVLAHEIGHHIYVPANLLDHGRLLARVRRGLPDREAWAPLVANLYADLLINDRLQRGAGLNVAGVYRRIRGARQSPLWQLYLRAYEVLWSLPTGHLAAQPLSPELQADAALAARVVRSFAQEWLDGAGRFAVLCLPYLLREPDFERPRAVRAVGGWCDTDRSAQGQDQVPAGLTEIDADEARGFVHPMFDPDLSGLELDGGPEAEGEQPAPDVIGRVESRSGPAGGAGQRREPFEYGQVLRALGLDLSDHDVAVRYYRELAGPYLVKYPTRPVPQAVEPLAEGLDTWEFGQPLEEIDWLQTVLASPLVVPGVTTRQRTWGLAPGAQPATRPVDLDLYVDCSGSMPNPQKTLSPVALAGAIIVLSALRVGASVQATLWSGAKQFQTTGGFVRDPTSVLRVLTGYIGGGTAFPIHLLRDTYADRKPTAPPVHLLVISDDGVTTMFQRDERGKPGREVSARALAAARGGGTMVLNLWREWTELPLLLEASQQGWDIQVVRSLDDLPGFARAFSARLFEST